MKSQPPERFRYLRFAARGAFDGAPGARSVVVILWNVNDAATAELMRRFYSGLKAGHAKDDALRQANLAVKKAPPWWYPYYWAPFVLQGDSGAR